MAQKDNTEKYFTGTKSTTNKGSLSKDGQKAKESLFGKPSKTTKKTK